MVTRFFSFSLDYLLISFISRSTLGLLMYSVDYLIVHMVSAFISVVYFVMLWYFFDGKTFGSLLFKTKVVLLEDKGKVKKYFIRAFCLLPFFFPFGVVLLIILSNIVSSIYLLRRPLYRKNCQFVWDVASETYIQFRK